MNYVKPYVYRFAKVFGYATKAFKYSYLASKYFHPDDLNLHEEEIYDGLQGIEE